jgi:hypothetical protein
MSQANQITFNGRSMNLLLPLKSTPVTAHARSSESRKLSALPLALVERRAKNRYSHAPLSRACGCWDVWAGGGRGAVAPAQPCDDDAVSAALALLPMLITTSD